MNEKGQSADLIMKLYDLRREEKMREARNWFAGFFPESVDDIMQATLRPETSGYYRMVISYWDMAASFVNHGAIDEEMFMDTGGECMVTFAKIEPYIEEIRETTKRPKMLANLENLVMRQPNAKETLENHREMMKRWAQARLELAKGA